MAEMITDTTAFLLREWGVWTRTNLGKSIGYPRAVPYAPVSPSRSRSSALNDDEAMIVDGVVARLVKRDPEMGKAVVLYYEPSGNASRVASALKVKWHRANVLVQCGTAWVDATLEARSA